MTLQEVDPLRKLLHDVRTPLAVIAGYADLLARRDEVLSDEERDEYLTQIRKSAAEIGAILDAATQPRAR